MQKKRKNWLPDKATAEERYTHGTHARYVLAKCRCEPCRKAASAYERNRIATKKRLWHCRYSPSGNLWVVRNSETGNIILRTKDAEKARTRADELNRATTINSPNELIPVARTLEHIAWLQSQGVGVKRISRVSTVANSVLNRMIEGSIKRTRRSTEARILSVTPQAVSLGSRMRADETIVLLERLVTAGYTRTFIARALGAKTHALQIAKSATITVRHAKEVHALYLRLQAQRPTLPRIDPIFTLGVVEATHARQRGRWKKRVAPQSSRSVEYPHGMRARYTEAGCRCKACVAANARFEKARDACNKQRYQLRQTVQKSGWIIRDTNDGSIVFRAKSREKAEATRDALNQHDPRSAQYCLVDVTPVRNHLNALADAGVHQNAVAKASGVSVGTLWHARTAGAKRIRYSAAKRILAVDTRARPDHAQIDATQTRVLLERLVAVGFSPAWINTVLGYKSPIITKGRATVRLDRARAVMSLYALLRERVAILPQLDTAA